MLDFLDEEGLAEVLVRAARGQAVLPADAMRRLMTGPAAAPEADRWRASPTPSEPSSSWSVRATPTGRSPPRCTWPTGTTRNYVSRLMHKLGVRRRAQVVALASLRGPPPRSDESVVTLPAARVEADRRA